MQVLHSSSSRPDFDFYRVLQHNKQWTPYNGKQTNIFFLIPRMIIMINKAVRCLSKFTFKGNTTQERETVALESMPFQALGCEGGA